MSKKLDVNRLIAEVKQRPALWDVRLAEYRDRAASALLWREIAGIVGYDVEQCKRKWKNIRDAYRAEVRRTERRVQRLKLEGHDDPIVSDSKWAFFKPMSFMSESKRKRYSTPPAVSNEFSNDSHEAYTAEAMTDGTDEQLLDIDEYGQVKLEHQTTDEETDSKHDYQHQHTATENDSKLEVRITPDDDDEANDRLFEQFQSVATPQAARRLSGTLTLAGSFGSNSPPTSLATTAVTNATLAAAQAQVPALGKTTAITAIVNSDGSDCYTTNSTKHASNNQSSSNNHCKCSQREDQVHFLEDLEREEQQLMQSTRRDITRANNMNVFGDSDYNFLVSFLPQMKRLSELQNLQFRAKMSELMLHIMAQPSSAGVAATVSTLPAFGCLSVTTATTPTAMLPRHHTHVVHHASAEQPHHSSHHVHFATTQPHQQQQQRQPHSTEAIATTAITWAPAQATKQTESQQEQQQTQ